MRTYWSSLYLRLCLPTQEWARLMTAPHWTFCSTRLTCIVSLVHLKGWKKPSHTSPLLLRLGYQWKRKLNLIANWLQRNVSSDYISRGNHYSSIYKLHIVCKLGGQNYAERCPRGRTFTQSLMYVNFLITICVRCYSYWEAVLLYVAQVGHALWSSCNYSTFNIPGHLVIMVEI